MVSRGRTLEATQRTITMFGAEKTILGALMGPTEEQRKAAAWSNVPSIPGSADKKDCDGRSIRWSEYGKLSTYGWEIDHATPICFGGTDALHNLRARHYQ